ncbi:MULTISPECIES: YqcI/YcgG family protein [unclassified Bartonella]
MTKSPFLGKYGEPQNREWTQYFLQDNTIESLPCSYHLMKHDND